MEVKPALTKATKWLEKEIHLWNEGIKFTWSLRHKMSRLSKFLIVTYLVLAVVSALFGNWSSALTFLVFAMLFVVIATQQAMLTESGDVMDAMLEAMENIEIQHSWLRVELDESRAREAALAAMLDAERRKP